MNLYAIYNESGNWLGNIRADSPLAALVDYSNWPNADRTACAAEVR